MKRISQSKLYLVPSLPRAVPWVSDPPMTPLKSVIDDISRPTLGGIT